MKLHISPIVFACCAISAMAGEENGLRGTKNRFLDEIDLVS